MQCDQFENTPKLCKRDIEYTCLNTLQPDLKAIHIIYARIVLYRSMRIRNLSTTPKTLPSFRETAFFSSSFLLYFFLLFILKKKKNFTLESVFL